jgi:hypothetical protein
MKKFFLFTLKGMTNENSSQINGDDLTVSKGAASC